MPENLLILCLNFRMQLLSQIVTLFVCFVLTRNVSAKSKKSKSVTTLLDAKWEASPLVLEIAEYLAHENVDFYWGFIDSISSLKPPLITLGKMVCAT